MQRTTAAFPRRSCRQPAAHRAAEGGARQARQGRDRRRRAARRSRTARSRRSSRSRRRSGSKLATDGEFRRSWWHFDFFKGLQGVELYHHRERHPIPRRARPSPKASGSVGKVGFSGHPHARAFQVSRRRTREVTPKMTIPAPSTLHFRQGRASDQQGGLSRRSTLSSTTRRRLAQGDPRLLRCRLPLSAARRHGLGDDLRSEASARIRESAATTPTALPARYARVTNAALEGKPADMAITMHSCRGNFRSTFIASGRLRVRRRAAARQYQSRRLFPRIRQRARRRLRAAALLSEGQEAACARPGHLEERAARSARTTSSAASTKRPNMSRSTSFACRRNAASPRPRRATCWPRTSSGPSCG